MANNLFIRTNVGNIDDIKTNSRHTCIWFNYK